jgi:7-carboxy-7-deazaguanine synthase
VTDRLRVSELFYSLQGESTRAGLPCAFIRLSGCNLRCSYCDSSYTWDEPGTETTITEISTWLEDFPGVIVEITGGEPLLQPMVYPLMEQLLTDKHTVLLETSGSMAIDKVPSDVHIILDIKCPGSGMEEKNERNNLKILQARRSMGSRDEIKFVLSSVRDFTWAKDMLSTYQLT